MTSSWGKSFGVSWGVSWGAIAAPVVEIPEEQSGRWAGEWLPIPVHKKLQPALPPKRKAKIAAVGPAPRASAIARVINPVRASATIVGEHPTSSIYCHVDNSIVDEEDSIIAALAALL